MIFSYLSADIAALDFAKLSLTIVHSAALVARRWYLKKPSCPLVPTVPLSLGANTEPAEGS